MKYLITICARGGSKGIPGKNIKMLNGLPLIAYTIKFAKSLQEKIPADIGLSTDSDEIISVAAEYGLPTQYKRPAELAGDSAGKIDTIKHLLEFEESVNNCLYDFVLDLDITSPLRTIDDISGAFRLMEKDKNALNLFSVSKATEHPYFNMVEKQENGYYHLVKRSGNTLLTRQSAPEVYKMNASFYLYRRNFFDTGLNSAITDRSLVYLVPHTCFDLDTPEDYDYLEYLVKNSKITIG